MWQKCTAVSCTRPLLILQFITDVIFSKTQLEEQFLHSSKFFLFSFIVLQSVAIAVWKVKKSGLKNEQNTASQISKPVLHYTVFFSQSLSELFKIKSFWKCAQIGFKTDHLVNLLEYKLSTWYTNSLFGENNGPLEC